MQNPKISVVIPSFNKEKYIGKTLDSIFIQKYDNLEVIIQDGGSTDGTLNVIKKYANKHNNISLVSKKDNGQLDAVNKGMKKASGEILTFINADDCYETKSFSRLSSAYINANNALWFAGRGIVVDENDNEIAKFATIYKNLLFKLNSFTLLLVVNYLIQPSIFITKSAYRKYGPFTGTSAFITEYDMWLKLGKISMPIIIDANLSRFRIEPTTKTKTMFGSLLAEDEKIVSKFTDNKIIIVFHKLNNFVRKVIGRFI